MTDIFQPLPLSRGPALPNRFMLAPLTNLQSHPDGTLSDDEFHWLTKRAQGGFGLVMTCASHVQPEGQGFPGQLGCFGDQHVAGLTRLARQLHADGAVSSVQLHHAGMRSPADLIGTTPLCPSDNAEFKARAMTLAEVEATIEAFIAGALRAEAAGFDGVELHGAHGYLLCQFLAAETNRRTDDFGGSLENRQRIFFEIIRGIRARCRADFQIGVRLSPERFGMTLEDARLTAQALIDSDQVDYLDLSLWDTFKEPEEAAYKGRSLLSWFGDLDRKGVRIGPAGKLRTPADVERALDGGADFVLLGRAAILHHDFPNLMKADAGFTPATLPVTEQHLRNEGLGEAFLGYMRGWKGFVAD